MPQRQCRLVGKKLHLVSFRQTRHADPGTRKHDAGTGRTGQIHDYQEIEAAMNRLSKIMFCSFLAALLSAPLTTLSAPEPAKSKPAKTKPSPPPATAATPAAAAPAAPQYQYPTQPAIPG